MSEIVTPTAPSRPPGTSLTGLLPRQDWLVVGWTLAIKCLLLVFGAKSYQILEEEHVRTGRQWFELWNRWDSLHYQKLAEFGYNASDVLKAWFYPLYPWTVRGFAHVAGDYLISAFVVSGVACMAAAILLRRLVALDHSAAIARRSVWFFLIFPTAYFLHIGYTESLFLALTMGSLFAARVNRWWLAGILGALSWMTRPTGLVLAFALAIEALHQFWLTRRWQWRWLWIAIVPAGFGVYLLINWQVTGDAFTFFKMREQLFSMSTAWPWDGIRETIRNMDRSPADAEMVGAQELYFTILTLACAILSWIKLRPAYAMWITGNWILFTSADFLVGVPRYALTLFPIFILFAMAARNRFSNGVITVWSLLFFALFASLFARGWWAF